MKKIFATFLLMGLAGISACETVNSTEREHSVGKTDFVEDHRVVTDYGLRHIARIMSINQSTLPGDILKIQAMIYNNSSFDKQITYKFEWYDNTGMIVESPLSTWQLITIQGKETRPISCVAPTPACKDFKLKLQESDRN